jgi:hypothetical protein
MDRPAPRHSGLAPGGGAARFLVQKSSSKAENHPVFVFNYLKEMEVLGSDPVYSTGKRGAQSRSVSAIWRAKVSQRPA